MVKKKHGIWWSHDSKQAGHAGVLVARCETLPLLVAWLKGREQWAWPLMMSEIKAQALEYQVSEAGPSRRGGPFKAGVRLPDWWLWIARQEQEGSKLGKRR